MRELKGKNTKDWKQKKLRHLQEKKFMLPWGQAGKKRERERDPLKLPKNRVFCTYLYYRPFIRGHTRGTLQENSQGQNGSVVQESCAVFSDIRCFSKCQTFHCSLITSSYRYLCNASLAPGKDHAAVSVLSPTSKPDKLNKHQFTSELFFP